MSKIARSTGFAIGPSALDDFLFGAIGEEPNGMTLSVFSGLARLGVDPRQEAARLASLPGPAAIDALTRMISAMTGGCWQACEAPRIAARLVGLLPKHGGAPADVQSPSNAFQAVGRRPSTWLILALLALLAIMILATNRQGPSGDDSDIDTSAVVADSRDLDA